MFMFSYVRDNITSSVLPNCTYENCDYQDLPIFIPLVKGNGWVQEVAISHSCSYLEPDTQKVKSYIPDLDVEIDVQEWHLISDELSRYCN